MLDASLIKSLQNQQECNVLWLAVFAMVMVVVRVSLQQQQQPLQQMLAQNFAVQNWNSTSHYQPYSQQPAAAPVDPGLY